MISISIIIPVYNVEPFIVRCLESVEKQDYQGPIECIVVDDYSTDNSLLKIKEHVKCHTSSHIKYIVKSNKYNCGVSVTRNTAMGVASGQYVYFLDGDDYLHPNAMSLLTEQVEIHPGIDMVMGTFDTGCHSTYHDIDIYIKHNYYDNPIWIQYAFLRMDVDFNITSTDKLTRREFLLNNCIFFTPNIIIHEDNHWLYQVLNHIKSLSIVLEKTYIVFLNTDSATHTIDRLTERKNWHRIIYDYSRNIYNPLRKLKLGRFMVKYYYDRLYELEYSKDKAIRFNFAKQAFLCKEYKVCTMLFVTLLFPRYSKRKDLNEHLKQHAYRMFVGETERNAYIL